MIDLGSAAADPAPSVVAVPNAPGDMPSDVSSRSDEFMTEYRFRSGEHTYALARALQADTVRELVFIDSKLACSLGERRYQRWTSWAEWKILGWGGTPTRPYPRAEQWGFLWDGERWTDPRYKWEWAAEPDGLDYLAAKLRQACGLEPETAARNPRHEWSTRTMTAAEIATAFDEVGPRVASRVEMGRFSYWVVDPVTRSERSQRQHSAAELCIWSLTLGLPQERLTPVLGPPDAEFVWSETGTIVNAYLLGSNYPCYVGIVRGKAAWVRGNYPGMRRQAEVATRDEVDSSQ